MEFVPLVVITSLIKKLVDFIKYAANGDVNAVVTQLVAWLLGIAVAFIAANSDWGSTIDVSGKTLASLNGWSLVLVGFVLASTAGVGWDLIKAVDGSNSAVVPALLHRTGAVPPSEPTV